MPDRSRPAPADSELFIGLMSGTSLDGVDAVIADCSAIVPRTLAHVHRPLPDALRGELLALNASGADELHRAQLAGRELALLYAAAVDDLLRHAGRTAAQVRAIGAHGQTVRHRPDLGYTVQLNAPALLAERTGIDVVADFRSRDIAAGGQGAPLVPAFHRIVFGADHPRAVVNIGGISNVTAIDGDRVIGFDAGPGNVLIDAWMGRHFGAPFDRDGAIAASSPVDENLITALLDDPYFAAAPPKSTGRDLFRPEWVLRAPGARSLPAEVLVASLTELTARAIAHAVDRWASAAQDVLVCGGGARNSALMRSLQRHLGPRPVRSTATVGVEPDQVESLAFAWLAQACVRRRAGNLPAATGAAGPRVLGAVYPAGEATA
jgi:anhydro-N-acetylmuramic acid kinase